MQGLLSQKDKCERAISKGCWCLSVYISFLFAAGANCFKPEGLQWHKPILSQFNTSKFQKARCQSVFPLKALRNSHVRLFPLLVASSVAPGPGITSLQSLHPSSCGLFLVCPLSPLIFLKGHESLDLRPILNFGAFHLQIPNWFHRHLASSSGEPWEGKYIYIKGN